MKRTFIALLFAFASFASADLKKINGTWKAVAGQIGGKDLPPALLKSMVLILKDGSYDYDEGHGHDVGQMKEVGKKKPLSIDIVGTEGPNKGKTYKAIYQFDGKVLRISYGLDGKRPSSFDRDKKGMILSMTYQRSSK